MSKLQGFDIIMRGCSLAVLYTWDFYPNKFQNSNVIIPWDGSWIPFLHELNFDTDAWDDPGVCGYDPDDPPYTSGTRWAGNMDYGLHHVDNEPQDRADDSGTLFTAWAGGGEAASCISGQDGACSIPLANGTYSVTAETASYLDSTWDSVSISEGEPTSLPTVLLLGGDTNDDCVINIQDLSFMGYHFNICAGDLLYDLRGDINGDGCINILDLSMAAATLIGPALYPGRQKECPGTESIPECDAARSK